MNALALVLLLQVSNPSSTEIKDEGTTQGFVRSINAVGTGIVATVVGNTGVLTVSAVGGSGNFVEVEVNFGATGNSNASTVVTGQTWVTTSSTIVCSPTMFSTADRAEGAEDAIIEGLTVAVHSRVAGTGFTLAAAAPRGVALGRYKVHCTGA